MMGNFFRLLFYDKEDNYKTIEELGLAIDDYINCYNYDELKKN